MITSRLPVTWKALHFMAKKKTEKVEKVNQDEKIKTLGLFDHLNQIQCVQDPDYFSKLTDGDKKTWQTWMINRFLSMVPDYIEIINEVQHLSSVLTNDQYYKLLIGIIPKRKTYSKFIKSTSVDKYSKNVMTFLANHFECSTREINDYLNILNENDIKAIYQKYGFEEKQIKKLLVE